MTPAAARAPVSATIQPVMFLMLGGQALLPGQTVVGEVLAAAAWLVAITLVCSLLAVRTYRRAVSRRAVS